jgi:hypothetical protein
MGQRCDLRRHVWLSDTLKRLVTSHCVARGQRLSRYSGQYEPPGSLSRRATLVWFGEVMSVEW